MEKLRWFPQHFPERYIFLNLASSLFSLIDKSESIGPLMNFKIINGRPKRKSPTMQDRIVEIIINPFWIVPPTIFREDKVEEIRKLSGPEIRHYFEHQNYEVWNKALTQKMDPQSIHWSNLDLAAPSDIIIMQKPNLNNALGTLKFLLTNHFSVYLHDTNQKELFLSHQRQLSSGCIRLERPLELADYLLKGTPWNREFLQASMAKRGEVLKKDIRLPLVRPIDVFMIFLTAEVGSDGVIRFFEDTYGQNKSLLRAGAWGG